jgi:hypothetical protein
VWSCQNMVDPYLFEWDLMATTIGRAVVLALFSLAFLERLHVQSNTSTVHDNTKINFVHALTTNSAK